MSSGSQPHFTINTTLVDYSLRFMNDVTNIRFFLIPADKFLNWRYPSVNAYLRLKTTVGQQRMKFAYKKKRHLGRREKKKLIENFYWTRSWEQDNCPTTVSGFYDTPDINKTKDRVGRTRQRLQQQSKIGIKCLCHLERWSTI